MKTVVLITDYLYILRIYARQRGVPLQVSEPFNWAKRSQNFKQVHHSRLQNWVRKFSQKYLTARRFSAVQIPVNVNCYCRVVRRGNVMFHSISTPRMVVLRK